MIRTLPVPRPFAPRCPQLALIAWGTLILCSCRSLPSAGIQPPGGLHVSAAPQARSAIRGIDAHRPGSSMGSPHAGLASPQRGPVVANLRGSAVREASPRFDDAFAVAPVSYTSEPAYDCPPLAAPVGPLGCLPCEPAPETDAWEPGPSDEYLCDGGDRELAVQVDRDWTVRGLDQEDTIVHFDTLDGNVHVEASNPECIYAPRFAAVRKVYGVVVNEQQVQLGGYSKPLGLNLNEEVESAEKLNQPLQPGRYLATDAPITFRDREQSRLVDDARNAALTQRELQPFEDFNVIRHGDHLNSEKARLAIRMAAARTWMSDEMVQIMVADRPAIEITNDVELGTTYVYDIPEGKGRARVVKVASKDNALPGEEVEFTIRFDNVGDQPIGNVTVIDSLTTRLEYVEGSQECSVAAEFLTTPNEGESLVLRWEIAEPLPVGEGGVIRFRCRVR